MISIALLLAKSPDVLALSETWLSELCSDTPLSFPGYRLFRSDRDRDRRGEGVVCYVRECISVKEFISPFEGPIEELWLQLSHPSLPRKLLLGCIYNPPDSSCRHLDVLLCNIECLMARHLNVLLYGDFNINIDISNAVCPKAVSILSFAQSHNLFIPLTPPTRETPSS